METAFVCATCGTQHAPSAAPPPCCPICDDERQYVPEAGQQWTTLELLAKRHRATLKYDGALLGIGCAPDFAIGQRALLVRTPGGNVLWDCIAFLDDALVEVIRALGGISAIAISHPHYYTTMLEWSRAFGGVPIHLHAADRAHVMRTGPEIAFWEGETNQIAPGLTLIRAGGHFAGGTVLHDARGAGALLTGDILQAVADRRFVGIMRSYPNYIPVGEAVVRRIGEILEPWPFDALYGAFWGRRIDTGARQAVAASIARHIAHLHRGWP